MQASRFLKRNRRPCQRWPLNNKSAVSNSRILHHLGSGRVGDGSVGARGRVPRYLAFGTWPAAEGPVWGDDGQVEGIGRPVLLSVVAQVDGRSSRRPKQMRYWMVRVGAGNWEVPRWWSCPSGGCG
jgi:hypothetical protein